MNESKNNIEMVLNEDSIKSAIDELCADIADFGKVDFVHILWRVENGPTRGRYYGGLDDLIAALEKAKFALMVRQNVLDDMEEDADRNKEDADEHGR